MRYVLLFGFLLPAFLPRSQVSRQLDKTAHVVRFVTTNDGVRLEVLDYGGAGRPMILLAPLGPDAHEWDTFAPKLTTHFHVYAITRRGFGASGKPVPNDRNYTADRLGDDVLDVMHALKLVRPILVGSSVGGEELSSVGSRHPQEVAGLVYLDAGYSYAFHDPAMSDERLDRAELRNLLDEAMSSPAMSSDLQRRLLTSLKVNEADLVKDLEHPALAPPLLPPGAPPMPPAIGAIMESGRKFSAIPVPILAIFAVPKDLSRMTRDPVLRAQQEAADAESTERQAEAFERGLPSARVVRIAHADHEVFVSNPADVIREIDAFAATLH